MRVVKIQNKRKIAQFILGKDNLSQLSEGTAHPENIAHSEKIIHDFMKTKEPSDMDEIAKEQTSRMRNGKVNMES